MHLLASFRPLALLALVTTLLVALATVLVRFVPLISSPVPVDKTMFIGLGGLLDYPHPKRGIYMNSGPILRFLSIIFEVLAFFLALFRMES